MLRRAFTLSTLALAAALAAQPALAQDNAQAKTITVFAAASMKNAVDDINAEYTKRTGVKVTSSYAASSPPSPSKSKAVHRPTSSPPPTSSGWTMSQARN